MLTTERMEAFSDGVFAVGITLLVFDIHVPQVNGAQLLGALLAQWPAYLSYVVSFLTIGIIWVNHHALFVHIIRADRNLLFLNLILLMSVAIIPFPTELLGEYALAGDGSRVSAVIYGGVMTLMAASFSAIRAYVAWEGRLIGKPTGPHPIRSMVGQSIIGPLIYAVGMVVAFISAPLSLALYAFLALFFAFFGGSVVSGEDEEKPDLSSADIPSE